MSDLTQVSYGDALFIDKYTLCGVCLRPLSLGHIILLETLKNPIIAPEEMDVNVEESVAQFFIALLICGLTYEDGLKMLTDETELGHQLNLFCENLLTNMEADPNWNIPNKLRLFKEYMRKYLEMPLYEDKSSTTEEASGADWKSSIFVVFRKLGYSESEILNMPIKKLFIIWCSYAESEGAIKIMNKYEVTAVKNLKR